MKILLIGKTGQIGGELNSIAGDLGSLVTLEREQMDLSKPNSIEPAILEIQPDIIINAAAYTAVDKAEDEPELAMAINGVAPGIMAKAAKKVGAGLVHYSTDYVFDGHSDKPYREEDSPSPMSVYGKSKLAGEKAIIEAEIPHLILRTSWVYSLHGKSFLKTIKKLSIEKDTLRIVDDQIGSPTWARSIALATHKILGRCLNKEWLKKPNPSLTGIFHLTCQGNTSWHGFAKEIIKLSEENLNTKLIPIPTSEYPTPAARPPYSVLCNEKVKNIFDIEMPHWLNAMKVCLNKKD
ncbi:MAG: dTDP-4-dehydrorhamnose reductase [Nitrospina sp.]|jgi:dTDP-4-dehydrorhamnose reductase|nr:dTDP-4-dehydrorhamnose reductase [Nitrospina sp.]